MMLSRPGVLLRIEGAAMFASSLLLYRFVEARWAVFFVLFLWPDLFMVGYLLNAKLGARLYNLVHSEALPLALGAVSVGLRQSGLLIFALIWLAHIGADRALGYGLKYPTVLQGHPSAAGESMTVATARRSTVQSSSVIRRSA